MAHGPEAIPGDDGAELPEDVNEQLDFVEDAMSDDDTPGEDGNPEEIDLDAIAAEGTDLSAEEQELDDILDRLTAASEGSGEPEEGPPPPPPKEIDTEYPDPPERKMKFEELLRTCGYDDVVLEQYALAADVEVTGLQYDSRLLQPGEIFVPLAGSQSNGYHFIPQAIERGASMIIAKVLLPGAELAYYTDVDPFEEGQTIELYDHPYYKAATNDIELMKGAAEEIHKAVMKADAFATKNGLSDHERAVLCAEQGLRPLSSVLGYDFSHWTPESEVVSEADATLTPHPYNPLIPTECDIPVVFALEPEDFAATLAEHFYELPSWRMTTVGVTGTRGKTTVSWLMRSVFEKVGLLTGMVGTIEFALATHRMDELGGFWEPDEVDTTLDRECSAPFWAAPYEGKYELPFTTPDNLTVQRVMAGMADRGARACVIECSSVGLEQGRLDEVDFDVAIFTNLSEHHLDYHETMDEYLEAKCVLFETLRDPDRQRAVVNIDDKHAQRIADAASEVPVVTYSLSNSEADVYCESFKFSIFSTTAVVVTPVSRVEITTPTVGRGMLSSMLAVIAAAISIDLELSDVAEALAQAEIVPGRYEIIDEGQDFSVLVDEANTPEALNALMDTVAECQDCARTILVFGCRGEVDKEQRRYMGEIAHFKADVVIITNDNPRSEAPHKIVADIVAGFPEEVTAHDDSIFPPLIDVGHVDQCFEEELLEKQGELRRHVIEDRFCAIRAAVGMAQKNDVVIIAGKGHRDFIEYCDINGTIFKAWFDDRVEARNALSKLQYISNISYLQRKSLPFVRK